MNLKRIYIEVNHDGPTFTDREDSTDLTTYDLILETNREICKDTKGAHQVIPAYIDLDEFPEKRNKNAKTM